MENNCVSGLVSVYITTKNRDVMLARAISSVLLQTYRLLEVIVIDDGSTDRTADILRGFRSVDSRVRVIANSESMGACTARNIAISHARGEFVTGLDDDDQWLPNRLEAFLDESKRLAVCSFIYTDDYIYDQVAGSFGLYPKKRKFSIQEFQKKNIIGNQIFTYTERLRISGFDPDFPSAQDYDCFYRMFLKWGDPYKLGCASQVLYVGHGENQITNGRKKIAGYLRFLRMHKNSLNSESRKYQLFTLRLISARGFNLRFFIKIFTLRNLVRYLFK